MIFTRETNPNCTYRTDGSLPHLWDYLDLRDQLDKRAAALGQSAPIPQFPTSASVDVDVYVNHGRWLWDCPTCHASYQAAGTGIGYCTNCWNAGQGFYVLAFPDAREQIERVLCTRPDPATRNWTPGESIGALEDENASHLAVV